MDECLASGGGGVGECRGNGDVEIGEGGRDEYASGARENDGPCSVANEASSSNPESWSASSVSLSPCGEKENGEVAGDDARRRWVDGEPLRGPHFGKLEVEVYLLVCLRLGVCAVVDGIIVVNSWKMCALTTGRRQSVLVAAEAIFSADDVDHVNGR